MADPFDNRFRRDVDLDETAAHRARKADPDRSLLETIAGREERGGFQGERNDDGTFEDGEDTPPYPLDATDDTTPSTVPGETVDGLDELDEEVRRQAEDRPLGPGPDD